MKVNTEHTCFPGIHTAQTLSEEFLTWFSSLEGGNSIPSYLKANKRIQKETQNKKIRYMIKTILEESLKKSPFLQHSLFS